MKRPSRTKLMLIALAAIVSMTGCYGATVGVYGTTGYGPSPWGGYPYPGRYPPMGGGVFVGVCCEEEEQQDGEQPEQDGGESEEQGADESTPDGSVVPRF